MSRRWRRWGPALAVAAALALEVALDALPARESSAARAGALPWASEAAAVAWARAAGPVELADALAADPPARRWLRRGLERDPAGFDGLDPAATVRLARTLAPAEATGFLAEQTGLSVELVAVMTVPGAASAVAPACPEVPRGLGPLCADAAAVRAGLAAVLARELAGDDLDAALRALAVLVREGGPLAVAAGERALGGAATRGRALGLVALAAGLPPEAAGPRLEALLADPDADVAMVAALELGRLGRSEADPALARLEGRLAGTAQGLLVAYARALAAGTAASWRYAPGAAARFSPDDSR